MSTIGPSTKTTPRQPCKLFMQGHCKFGNRCKFIHGNAQLDVNPSTQKRSIRREAQEPSGSRNSLKSSTNVRGKNPCYRWQAVGKCAKGDQCSYRHDPEVQNTVRSRDEANKVQEALHLQKEHEAQVEASAQRKAAIEAVRKAREQQQEIQREERAKEDAAKVLQHVVHDFTVVTFGAGAAIQGILTGFESCRVRVKNIPPDATLKEVSELFTQQGIDIGRFQVIGMNKTPDGKQEAHVVWPEEARVMAVGLDAIEFREEKLSFEVYQSNSTEGMRPSTRTDGTCVLTISWRPPAVGFVVTFVDVPQAEAKVRELDGKNCAGRKVKVEMNRQPRAGQPLQHSMTANALVIRGLPPDVTDTQVAEFAGSIALRRLKPTQYDTAQVPALLRVLLETTAASQFNSFQTGPADAATGAHTVHVHFGSWDDAKLAYDALDQKRFNFIGNAPFQLRLPFPLHYTLTIPLPQYHAQRRRWDGLRDGTKQVKGCKMWINPKERLCIIVVQGDDRKAVGSLKVRVEVLAAGDTLQTWHRALGAPRFLDSVLSKTGAFLRNDWRNRVMRAYGEQDSINAAREMVAVEVARLDALEYSVFLKRQSVGFFVRRGLEALKEELGAEKVALDISSTPCKITITGSEAARHALHRLIDESLNNIAIQPTAQDSTCPICYDTVAVPVQLACGHVYCTACIMHFLTSAADSKIFPLSCMGADATCNTPIPLSIIERYLTPDAFKTLLEAAFSTHVGKHPRDLKYCPTPDCGQVYRCSAERMVLHCPACLCAVCAACHEDAHEGMTCTERRIQGDPALQERLNDELAMRQGFKKCPSCHVLIEKTDGCNHMECKCGAHICWVCMGTFTANTVYPHMQTAHGGYYNGPAGGVVEEEGDRAENFRMQEELLAQAAQRMEQRRVQERLQEARHLQQEDALRRVTAEAQQHLLFRREMQYRRDIQLRREIQLRRDAEQRREAEQLREAEQRRQVEQRRQEEDKGWACVIM